MEIMDIENNNTKTCTTPTIQKTKNILVVVTCIVFCICLISISIKYVFGNSSGNGKFVEVQSISLSDRRHFQSFGIKDGKEVDVGPNDYGSKDKGKLYYTSYCYVANYTMIRIVYFTNLSTGVRKDIIEEKVEEVSTISLFNK